jgi:hypothetical protein
MHHAQLTLDLALGGIGGRLRVGLPQVGFVFIIFGIEKFRPHVARSEPPAREGPVRRQRTGKQPLYNGTHVAREQSVGWMRLRSVFFFF